MSNFCKLYFFNRIISSKPSMLMFLLKYSLDSGGVSGISATTFQKAQIDEPSFCNACVGRRARQEMHIRSHAPETKGLRYRIAPLPTMSKSREGLSQIVGGDIWTVLTADR